MPTGAALGCIKGGIPSHGFGESPFWGDSGQTEVYNWFKMYVNGRYCEADRREDDLWVVAIGKTGVFPDPGIRI